MYHIVLGTVTGTRYYIKTPCVRTLSSYMMHMSKETYNVSKETYNVSYTAYHLPMPLPNSS